MKELIQGLDFPFLALNIRDTEWNEPAFDAMKTFEKGGIKIAVLGQAFPYTPVANPRWMMPKWSFGIREEDVRPMWKRRAGVGRNLSFSFLTMASMSTASLPHASRVLM